MALKQITVKIDITEKHEEALRELLPHWQKYESERSHEKPFANITVEKLCEMVLQIGCFHDLWKKIKEEQQRQGLISIEEMLDCKEMTVAERIEARKQKEGGAQ